MESILSLQNMEGSLGQAGGSLSSLLSWTCCNQPTTPSQN